MRIFAKAGLGTPKCEAFVLHISAYAELSFYPHSFFFFFPVLASWDGKEERSNKGIQEPLTF